MWDFPEYLVLADKGNDKTYEMCDTLSDAYDEADRLRAEGWKIYEILNAKYKEQFGEDYEYLSYLIKNRCEELKTEELTRKRLKEIKKDIHTMLFEKELNTDNLKEYIDYKIEMYLGWNESEEIITEYLNKKLND